MQILLIGEPENFLKSGMDMIRRCAPETEVRTCDSPAAALDSVDARAPDAVFLDMDMRAGDTLALVHGLMARRPRLNLICCAADFQDMLSQLVRLRVSGCIRKPLTVERVQEELSHLRHSVRTHKSGLYVRTFGNFEVFFDGRPLLFRYQKTRELFAYLVDRRGAMVSRDEQITILWGGETERRNYYKQIQKDLNDTLKAVGMEHILVRQRNAMGVLTDRIDCDYYSWLSGDEEARDAYMGEYMRQYDWAETTNLALRAARRRQNRG